MKNQNPEEIPLADEKSIAVENLMLGFSKERLELAAAMWSWQAISWAASMGMTVMENP